MLIIRAIHAECEPEKLCNQSREKLKRTSCVLSVRRFRLEVFSQNDSCVERFREITHMMISQIQTLACSGSIFTIVSLVAGNARCTAWFWGLVRALVGAQQHLVLGGALRATALLFHQEFLESAGGEGEGLPPQLHKVRVLQPSLREAVSSCGTGPESTEEISI